MKRFWVWFLNSSLWIVSMGMMLASAGIDGSYLVKLMPVGLGFLGQILNTTSDVASEIIMYWFGRLQMDGSATKRKRARWLLVAEFVLVGFSWLFGWRQLLPILAAIEGKDAVWLAPIMAAFTPTALIAAGFAQALLAGKIEKGETEPKPAKVAQIADEQETKHVEPVPVAQPRRIDISEWREIAANLNGDRANLDAKRVNEILVARGYAPIPESTARYWCEAVREMAQ